VCRFADEIHSLCPDGSIAGRISLVHGIQQSTAVTELLKLLESGIFYGFYVHQTPDVRSNSFLRRFFHSKK
jgi:hypothetical protein